MEWVGYPWIQVVAGKAPESRELLRTAHVIDVAETFSREEHDRATALSHTDGRIHTALSVSDTGPVQVLAAGPALVRWWDALRAEVDAGTDDALEQLVSLLTTRGLLDRHGAKRLRRFGFTPEGRPN